MTKSLIKNTFREIKNTKARFISIMAIIALGVGFFAGIKATVPSMYNQEPTRTSRSLWITDLCQRSDLMRTT